AQPGPMQDIVVLDLLVRVEVEPALAALLFRPAVPGDRQRLQAAVGKLDQVLLQRVDAESVFHLERGEPAVGPIGLDQKFPVLAEEAGMQAVVIEARVVEIAEHRLVGRVIHRQLVLRRAPERRLRLMTLCASLAADECGRRSGGAEQTRPWRASAGEPLPGDSARNADEEDRGCADASVPGTRRHCCSNDRRASNDTRTASACLRQAGTLGTTSLSTIARAG